MYNILGYYVYVGRKGTIKETLLAIIGTGTAITITRSGLLQIRQGYNLGVVKTIKLWR